MSSPDYLAVLPSVAVQVEGMAQSNTTIGTCAPTIFWGDPPECCHSIINPWPVPVIPWTPPQPVYVPVPTYVPLSPVLPLQATCQHCYCKDSDTHAEHKTCCKCGDRLHKAFTGKQRRTKVSG